MVTSEARRLANARNAQRSTGPKSDEGKKRSSMNALKHGLTAREAVLYTEDPAAYQDDFDQWVAFDKPTDPAHVAAIECCVSARHRRDRGIKVENQRAAERMRRAAAEYDLQKFIEAELIGRRLIDDPINRCDTAQSHDPVFRAKIQKRLDDNPAILVRQLLMSSQGADWLLLRWQELADMLNRNKFWHYPEKFRAVWMLGKNPHDVFEDRVVQKIFLACNVAHPDVSDTDPDMMNLYDECYQAKMGIAGKPMYVRQLDNIRGLRPPDALTAQAQLWDIIKAEMDRLRALKANVLDELDRLGRESAETRAMFDDSKEGVLLLRYRTACEREYHRALSDLMKIRKERAMRPEPDVEEAPLPNEATAESDAEEVVTSNGLVLPEFDAVPTDAAARFDTPMTPAGPVPAPD